MVCLVLVALLAGRPGFGLTKTNQAQIRAAAGTIMENILQALAEGEYEAYVRDWDDELKKLHPPAVFEQKRRILKEKIGRYVSKEFVKLEANDGVFVVHYSAFFTREQGQVKVRLVLTRRNGDYKVTGLWFDAPALNTP